MRLIKFRAWDKENKKMEYKDWYDLARYGWIVHEYWDDFIFMQFTGLLDKNGKEIYEGDVVTKKGGGDILCDIVTMERFPVFWLKNEHFGYEGEELISPEDCKVIGNIYENPELLKEVK